MLADMAIGIESSRAVTYWSAWEVDQVCYKMESEDFGSFCGCIAINRAVKTLTMHPLLKRFPLTLQTKQQLMLFRSGSLSTCLCQPK